MAASDGTNGDEATIDGTLMGEPGGQRWINGTFDAIPLHVVVASDAAAALADGDTIAPEHLQRLAAVVTRRIGSGGGRFGRREHDGHGMLVVELTLADWHDPL